MKKKIFVRAPVLSQSGYGEQSRFALRALRSQEHIFDIYIQPIPWGQTGWIWETGEFRDWMDSKIATTQLLLQNKQLQPDISLQITIPNEFEKLCPINVGYTAGIETTKVAPTWLQKGNEAVDKILVVSEHARTTYKNTKAEAQLPNGQKVPYSLETPIEVVGECTPRAEPEEIPNFNLDTDFNFLTVSQVSPRKNFENTIKWWIEEFHDENVGLIIKTNIRNNTNIDLQATDVRLKTLVNQYPDKTCKVYLLHGDLSVGQMTGLYKHPKIKALVNIAHGEGFGLPMFEAAREALPVVTVGWSGHLDFLTDNEVSYFQEVDYSLSPIQEEARWEGVLQPDSMWAYADEKSYKETLRATMNNWEECKATADKLQTINKEKFSTERLYSRFCEAIFKPSEEELEWMKDLSEIEIL